MLFFTKLSNSFDSENYTMFEQSLITIYICYHRSGIHGHMIALIHNIWN
jgi:hypothetical protein